MPIGKRILQAMQEQGVSQSELARRVGMRPQAVHQWVRDVNPLTPRSNKLEKIARALKKSPEWFVADRKDSALLLREDATLNAQQIAQQAMHLSAEQRRALVAFLQVAEGLGDGEER